jgi:hypothetical protein
MKKGDEVVDDEDDDVVRTSMSQDQVTATLCTDELFLSTQYISSPHISESSNVRGGGHGQSTRYIQQYLLDFTPPG